MKSTNKILNTLLKEPTPFLTCKDHVVSGEQFDLKFNKEYEMLITFPRPKEIHSYYETDNYISHTDSKKSFIDKLYQLVKSYSLKKKVGLINSFKSKHKTVLDIGAGTGDFLLACKKNNWEVFGVEPSKKARDLALKKGVLLAAETIIF